MSASIWTPGSNNVPAVDPLSQIASQRFTATEGQTAFVITTFTYAINVGALTVYVNRTKIPITEITETSESTFTLLQPCDVGDLIEVIGQTAIEDPSNAVNQAEAAAAAAVASAAAAAIDAAQTAQDAADAAASAADAASYVPVDWRGNWVTATLYEHNDAVFHLDGSYICTTVHTSTNWAADAAYWELLAQSGGTVSVNGETGVVQLDAVDIPYAPSGNIAAANVQAALMELDAEKAALASPVFTGNPTAPTAAPGDNDTSIATTAFVQVALSDKAPLASPVFTGDPKAPTPLTSDNDTSIATTAFVQSLLSQQPPGVQVSNSTPLINGVAAPGVGVEASRYDHIHPSGPAASGFKAFAPPAGAFITLTNFTGEAYDLTNNFDPVTGRFTVTVKGIYSVTTNVYNNVLNQKAVRLLKNGVVTADIFNLTAAGVSGSVSLDLLVGEYLQVELFQATADSLTAIFQIALLRTT